MGSGMCGRRAQTESVKQQTNMEKKHMVTESFKLKKEESVDERLDLGDSEPGFDADHEYGEGEFEERELKQEEHGLVNQMDEKLEEETEADENAGEFTDDIGRS